MLQLDKKYIKSNLYLCHIFDIYQFHSFRLLLQFASNNSKIAIILRFINIIISKFTDFILNFWFAFYNREYISSRLRGKWICTKLRAGRIKERIAGVMFNKIIWRIARISKGVLKPLTISLVNHGDEWSMLRKAEGRKEGRSWTA